MPKLTFYPLGNADCSLVDLAGGEKLLFDYANKKDPEDDSDKRIDLAMALREDLQARERDGYEVVAFTHLDDDHIHGSTEFFFLEHAQKYQGDDRVKIETLWVPAAVIIDSYEEEEAKIIQKEARHRLRKGTGIRVFSRPGKLKDWFASQGLSLEDRAHLITDAGQFVPGFTQEEQGVAFFVHSPFAHRLEDGTLIDPNTDSLVVQAAFLCGAEETKLILGSDVDYDALSRIVNITKSKKREDRLEWDVFKIPHHCSYLTLNSEKGQDKTEPVDEVKWLLEEQGQEGSILVSTSKPIPGDDEDNQPPHRQAANYYKEVADDHGGEFKVTMEHPTADAPRPLVIHIDESKATIEKRGVVGAAAIATRRAPRAG